MKVVIKEPNKDMEVKNIKSNLKTLQNIVGGYIEGIYLSDKLSKNMIFAYGDEEAKFKNKKPNFWIYNQIDLVCGTAIFCKDNGKGEETDLTDNDIELIKEFLKENEITDKD